MLYIRLLLALCLISTSAACSQAQAGILTTDKPDGHAILTPFPTQCFKFPNPPKQLGETTLLPNGLLEYYWDVTYDRKPDLVTYAYDDTSFPLFYVLDKDNDNEPDLVLIDPKGKGDCKDIVVYRDLLAPTSLAPGPSPEMAGKRT